ncbi:hypothetical protein Ac2012v2_8330 [Leucoagaricus gongylophorus]
MTLTKSRRLKGYMGFDSSSYVNRVSDNNDFQNITEIRGLVNSAPNSEQFCF